MLRTTEQSQTSGDFGAPIDWRRVTITLRRRRWFVIGAAIVGTIAGATIAKTVVEPVFEAQCILECDRCARPELGERELATLQETVKLPQHLDIAIAKLGLPTTVDNVDTKVQVSASLESRLIQVVAREKTGALAAELANTVVDAFLETRLQIEKDILEARLLQLQSDADKARAAVIGARENYDQFRRENNISDLATERQVAIQEAARLHSELAIARGEEQAERARALALHRATMKEPPTALLFQTEDLPDLKKLSEVRSQLMAAQVRFSVNHPRVLALAAEAETLERKVAAANESVATGRTIGPNPQKELASRKILEANANQEAANTRQTTYEQLAQDAARVAARLANIEGRASELSFLLETAERHASAIALALKEAEDAARTPATGLRILARARVPNAPVESSRQVVAILGPFIGTLLAMLMILLRELRGFRVHTARELAFWGQGATITTSMWPRSASAFPDLVAELATYIRQSRGKTLVLGANDAELPHIDTIVQSLQAHVDSQTQSDDFESLSIATVPPHCTRAELRYELRNAARVLIVVTAGRHTASAIAEFVQNLSYSGPVGFVLLNQQEEYAALAESAGDVDTFWKARRAHFRRTPKSSARRYRMSIASSKGH